MIKSNIKKHTFVEVNDITTILRDFMNNPVLWDEAWEAVSDDYYEEEDDSWDTLRAYDEFPF
jgi:hypothetical protein